MHPQRAALAKEKYTTNCSLKKWILSYLNNLSDLVHQTEPGG
ncbi:MAG: hypothetical protein DDT40_00080 [candidate division WS2 bacterium]|nr:hypothetical protein [Candidatus Psychracetigena formicireducens]